MDPEKTELKLKEIEQKWQRKWAEARIFEADPIPGKKKYFVNFPYPYMNGYLHIGHAFSLMRVEILARYKRMTGHNVLFPFAFHCTGTPIVAAAERIKNGEEGQIKILKEMGIPEEDIPRFSDPVYWTQFFPVEAKKDLKALGIGVDWRRSFITTSLNPFYSKFIEWQFLRLKEEGLIKKGEYPVIWCPHCNAPTGDHARLKGEGERPQEFTLLKFRIRMDGHEEYGDRVFLLAATLRPETVFGQTNLWVDPDVEYAIAEYTPEHGDGKKELWIMSKQAVKKLQEQKKDLRIVGRIKGSDLIGKRGLAPAIHREIPVLPSHFCDPDKGTGIVTSVPSDAPDDYMGLHDLQNDPEECRKYGLDPEEIQRIEPIPIIESADRGTNPAVKICQQMGIKNQFEREKLEAAKHEIYRSGFYTGKMTEICGEYAGRPVEEVKDEIKARLISEGEASLMYEPSGEVVCRCLTKCIVRVVDNQWFIAYSDPEWKKKAHRALDRMILYPETARRQFDYVLDWLNDWACTREFGLGTPLPWDRKWLIESLSDSTIYMAYYTLSKYLEHGIVPDASRLNYQFFDYIFRENGEPKEIADNAGISRETLEQMKNEFLYWYPFDFRGSGKDLVHNHLSFCLFNHVAVFPEGLAPESFGVNGWIKVAGAKMSKSAGNFFTLRELAGKYGADVVRLTLGIAGEGLEDPNFEPEFAESAGKRLLSWKEFALTNYTEGGGQEDEMRPFHEVDRWFRSRLHRLTRSTGEQMELTNFRSALKSGYFDLQNAFRWYQKRTANSPHPALVKEFIETQTLILTPYTPHICEEIWQGIGKEGFISEAPYPEARGEYISDEVEVQEDYLIQVMEDIRKILKVTKMTPERVVLYTSPAWKYRILRIALESGDFNVKDIMKKAMADLEIRRHGKEVSRYVQQLAKERPAHITEFDEFDVLAENLDYIAREFDCKAEIYRAEDEEKYDPAGKAKAASPYRPAIYLE